MAGFTNTSYSNTVTNIVSAATDRFKNPYYMFTDKKATVVTYYRINRERSTLDESAKIAYSNLDITSPLKYTKIKQFLLFGLAKIELDYNLGDFGLETAEISGDAVILPNTLRPQEGDFFSIDYLKEPLLFMVTKATPDTLDTGANIWKIDYSLNKSNSIEQIEKQVVKNYTFVASYVGTDYTCFMQDEDLESMNNLQNIINALSESFINLFYDQKLQTFVYSHNSHMFYDPYLIEFIRRNKLITKPDGSFFYVEHACALGKLFPIEYLYTLFAALEQRNFPKEITTMATADLITDINSLFVTRMRDYYLIRYKDNTPYKMRFETIPCDVVNRLSSGESYESGDERELYNIWIEYFSKNEISQKLITILMNKVLESSMEVFYIIPVTIFVLKNHINSLMLNNTLN